MSLAREVVDELLQRLTSQTPNRRTVVRPSVTRNDIEHVYIHRARPVVQRVRRVQHIIPVVQPLIEEGDSYELPVSTQQRVGALRRRGSTKALSSQVRSSLRLAEDQLLDTATGGVSESHTEDAAMPEEIAEESVIQEVVEDVMPLRRRTVRQPTVVEEVQPIHETITEIAGVGDVEHRAPMRWADWTGADGAIMDANAEEDT